MLNKLAIILSSSVIADTANAAQEVTQHPLFGFAEYGVLGLCVIALAIALVRKDRQVNALYIRLIEKAEKDSTKYHELAAALDETLKELIDAVELR